MKKSELLKLPPMKATKEMYEKAWLEEEYDHYQRPSVTGPKYRKFYRARKKTRNIGSRCILLQRLKIKDISPSISDIFT